MKICPQCKNEYDANLRFCPQDATILQPKSGVAGRVVGGRYEILEEIGSGGMGSVFRVKHIFLQEIMALKKLHLQFLHEKEFMERFRGEALKASRVKHPNVVRISDYGEEADDFVYFVMEYIDGSHLGLFLQKYDQGMPLDEAYQIIRQIAIGLAEIHRANVIHRDLKPENIMIQGVPGGGRKVTILDFGIARALEDSRLTRPGTVMGSPQFMSPEQANEDLKLDHRSDIYNLGLIFYYLLLGRPPFVAAMSGEYRDLHRYEDPQAPRLIRKEIPRDIETIVLKAMAKDPEQRYQTAEEFVAALEEALQPGGKSAFQKILLWGIPLLLLASVAFIWQFPELRQQILPMSSRIDPYLKVRNSADSLFMNHNFSAAQQAYAEVLHIRPGDPHAIEKKIEAENRQRWLQQLREEQQLGELQLRQADSLLRISDSLAVIDSVDSKQLTGTRRQALDLFRQMLLANPDDRYLQLQIKVLQEAIADTLSP